jgi:hypothetical protein
MTSWQRFESEARDLAAKVGARFTAEKSHVLATVRRDGSPRVSGTEVDFSGPDLLVGSMLNAVKALDLQRDGRFAVHAAPGAMDGGDAKVAGVAVEVTDPVEIEAVQGDAQPCHLFRLDLTEVVLTWVEDETMFIETWWPESPASGSPAPATAPPLAPK